jgi:hypothetical protein
MSSTSAVAPTAARAQTGTRTWVESGVEALRRHWPGLAVALILTASLSLPRWWMLTTQPAEGTRVPISVFGGSRIGSDEAREATVIRQAYDGKLPLRAPYLANHKDGTLQAGAGLPEAIGVLGHVTGGPFESLALATTLMSALALLLLYALGVRLTGSRWIAAGCLPLAVFAGQVLYRYDGFAALRHADVIRTMVTAKPSHEFLFWSRYISPTLVLAPFFAVALALPRAVGDGDKRWGVVAAISLAWLVYAYIFFWTAAALALGAWGGWLLYRRDFEAFRRLAVIGVAAVLLALPEVAITINKSLSSSGDAQARVGLESKGIELRAYVQRGLIGLPFFYGVYRSRIRYGSLFVCLFMAPIVLASTHGLVPQSWHYRSQVWGVFAIPLVLAGSAGLLQLLGRREMRLAGGAFAVAGVCAAAYVGAFQVRTIRQVDASYAVSDDESAALRWMRENVHSDETVVSPSIVTTINVAAMTPASEYIMGGFNPVANDDELIDRYLRVSIAYGYGEDDIFQRIDPYHPLPFDTNDSADELMQDTEQSVAYYTFYSETDHPNQLAERLPEWHERFDELKGQADVLAAYPADYLYCGERERLWPVQREPSGIYVTVAFHQGTVTVYHLTNESDPNAEPFKGCE